MKDHSFLTSGFPWSCLSEASISEGPGDGLQTPVSAKGQVVSPTQLCWEAYLVVPGEDTRQPSLSSTSGPLLFPYSICAVGRL